MAPPHKPLRSDAERNRERIIAAARLVFARDGLNASMASVAREAGVGIATMFGAFRRRRSWSPPSSPTAWTPTPRRSRSPWRTRTPGTVSSATSRRPARCRAADYGFADVLTMTFPTAKALERRRDEAYASMVELIGRAKATGRLREDFDPSDLVLIHMANAGVVNATGEAAPDAWRRVVALLIQSLEAPARGPLPDSPEHDALYKPCSAPAPGVPPLRSRTRAADLRIGSAHRHKGVDRHGIGPGDRRGRRTRARHGERAVRRRARRGRPRPRPVPSHRGG
ncbi:hypothetical protein GCM10011428_58040 [Streptomyces violaceus]